MREDMTCRIERNSRGYYALYIDGEFAGNFDSVKEAADEYEAVRALEEVSLG